MRGRVTKGSNRQRLLDDIYFSVDCEFSGPIPGPHYMMSFGSVAFTLRKGIIGKFAANLKPLEGATMHPRTQRFWDKNPDAYESTQFNQVEPAVAMQDYSVHIMDILRQYAVQPQTPIFIEYPGGADFVYMFWYFHRFLGDCPFSHSTFSLKTAASVILDKPFRRATKANMPRRWFNPVLKHTHLALDDALGQADLAIRMLCQAYALDLPPLPTSMEDF